MIHWERSRQSYSCLVGKLGEIRAFGIDRSVIRNEGYSLYCHLPGVDKAKKIIDCKDEEEAKEKADEVLAGWLKAAGLKQEAA